MARRKPKSVKSDAFNIAIVGQAGRLGYEALLFAASLRANAPDFKGQLYVMEPQPGPKWSHDPRIAPGELRNALAEMGAEIVPFESVHFGQSYPYGNKIEMLSALPKGEPFVFFDTDTLILNDPAEVPFDFAVPSASLRREATWPQIELYGPGYGEIWKSLYDRFELDFEGALDPAWPDEYWQRYPYYNAGYFYYRCPHEFGERFLDYALSVRNDPPPALVCQALEPWLDQIVLPLVIHGLGGRKDALPAGLLDGDVTCHYRVLPLLYAREADAVVTALEEVSAPNKIKKVLKGYDPFKRMIYQGRGQKVRALFDRDALPRKEQALRNKIKNAGFWMR
ncbi:MAG: hypothetical protein HRU30_10765 [Rhodobacteraceae bacterium]|nr:hypothetical protein [Paracoccaceae bacterium]